MIGAQPFMGGRAIGPSRAVMAVRCVNKFFLFSFGVFSPCPCSHKELMGRKKLYTPHLITFAEWLRVNAFAGCLGNKDAKRDLDDFKSFCQINTMPTDASSFAAYAALLLEHKMDPGSILSKQKNIQSELRNDGKITWYQVKKELSLRKARLGRKHAVDATTPDLAQILNNCPSCIPRTRLIIMYLTGARNADLEEQRDGTWYIAPLDDSVQIKMEVLVAKARRLPEDHTTLTLSGRAVPWNLLSPSAKNDALHWKPSAQKCTTADLLIWMKRNVQGLTSYSFRRNYVHRMVEMFTGADDIVCWKNVMEKTLHFSERTIKASYMKHTSDM